MTSTRQFITETLKNYTPLQPLIADRVYQGESLTQSTIVKPCLIYRMGNDTDMRLAEYDVAPHTQFFQVYVHDEPADYDRIDDMVKLVIAAFKYVESSAVNRIITTRYLETSRDLDDAILNTIFRYIRFQFVMS